LSLLTVNALVPTSKDSFHSTGLVCCLGSVVVCCVLFCFVFLLVSCFS
jgi:hypothetical protein